MAEQLKVFTDATLTGADFTGGTGDTYALVTTTGTTQAVVKDIAVGTVSTGVTGSFQVGVKTVSSTLISMSGSEILDVSETLDLVLPDSVDGVTADSYVKIPSELRSTTLVDTEASSNTSATVYGTSTSFLSTVPIELVEQSLSKPVPTMTNPAWVVYDSDDTWACYFRYDGNSACYLYRASVTAGVVGTWVVKHSDSFGYVNYNDKTKKFYWESGGALKEYNPVTDASVANITTGLVHGTSYAHNAVCGDYFFKVRIAALSTIEIVKISTGDLFTVTGISTAFDGGQYGSIAVAKNDTDYVIFTNGVGTTAMRVHSIPIATLEGGVFTGSDFTHHGTTQANIIKANQDGPVSGSDDGFLAAHGNSGFVEVRQVVTGATQPAPFYTGAQTLAGQAGAAFGGTQVGGGSLTPAELDISIPVRVSGVEVTEVA